MQSAQIWLTIFVGIIALACAIQAIISIAMFILMGRMVAKVDSTVKDLRVQIAPTMTRLQILIDEVSPRIAGIATDASDITRLARGQVQKVDRVLTESIERFRLQLIHVDRILTGATETLESAGGELKRTVMNPIVRATAVIRGIQTGVEFFRSNRHNNSKSSRADGAHQDEGMFI